MSYAAIRPGLPSDAAALAAFGRQAFADTFGHSADPNDLAEHLANTYGAQLQRAELADPDSRFLVAEADGEIVGYSLIRRDMPRAPSEQSTSAEVRRFYVSRNWQGSGLADRLMIASKELAGQLGARSLWLGVWEENHRAIRFYQRHGFAMAGRTPFRFGGTIESDLLLTATVDELRDGAGSHDGSPSAIEDEDDRARAHTEFPNR